ncbi:glycosyltransferase family A protein [Halomonas sp. SpR1]|uniref:glycosyltransferase family 2 protein n=1 Tax=Halomonas sp. SpR1 TaxID=3050462 RepID=UPI0027E3FCCD|nr:glycosyltransferase family A protein [Halomonas sp. SpR1]MDQ7733388.1 glycosyltransferase family A protein [Halomonas sp. SpR1]
MSDIAAIEQSPWFDADWYMMQYPDVTVSGMKPAEHYLLLGEAWGRWAGPRFDSKYYLERYQDVAKASASPLLHFIRNGEKEGRWPIQLCAQQYEELLWQQTAIESQLASLRELLNHQDPWEASYSAWALGRWYAWKGEWQACAKVLACRHTLSDAKPTTPTPRLLEVEALTKSGQLVAAWQCIQQLEALFPDYADTPLAKANLLAAQAANFAAISTQGEPSPYGQADALTDQFRLQQINTLFQSANLCPVALKDPSQPLTLDNLTVKKGGVAPLSATALAGLVSVIVPVFNAEAHLATALRSLAEQSYSNIEVIVVDDASTDSSLAVAQAFSQQDSRFKVISQTTNQGAYAARNRGLEASKGAFITVHDSDDWSHPQKLERQVNGLVGQSKLMACRSHWVRCNDRLYFGHWRLEDTGGWIYPNTSSLMFRRSVVDSIGYWDRVRVNGDTEYLSRIRQVFGAPSVGSVMERVPLSLGRSVLDSLSQAGATHLITQFNGVRQDYMQAALAWHAQAKNASDLYLPACPSSRPFVSPAANLPG